MIRRGEIKKPKTLAQVLESIEPVQNKVIPEQESWRRHQENHENISQKLAIHEPQQKSPKEKYRARNICNGRG